MSVRRLRVRALLLLCATVVTACSSSAGSSADTNRAASASTNGASAKSGVAGATLRAVRARGSVRCGISQAAGFATPNDAGQWQGFDVDFCRAVAVAVFGDPAKVEFVPYTQSQRFSGLQSGEVDLLVNGTSLTISRTMQRGFHFGPVYLYDGQAFLVPEGAERQQGRGARRRDGLRAAGHDDGAQPHRLRAPQQHQVPAGRHRGSARRRLRARWRALRRHHPGWRRPGDDAHDAAKS